MISVGEFLSKIAEADLPYVVTNKRIVYYNVPAGFDIETSSFYQYGEKKACMYIWMFGILNWVTYGRTWEEYISFIKILKAILGLNEKCRLPVYVHNLPYEFQFMRKHFSWTKLFFLDERKPVYAIAEGIEYRCSLKLSSKSLAKVGQDLQKYKVEKKVGDLDYSLIRTSETQLTEKELGYCENDIRVILAYIMEKIETDGDVSLIPMTNTGYVRNFCRKQCFKNYNRYYYMISDLTLEPDEYNQLKRGFAGGFTHASANYFGEILHNVGSYDFTSSYPAVMLAEKFPMSKSKIVTDIDSLEKLKWYLSKYCCLFDITFENIRPKLEYDHPISISKCWKDVNVVTDNGRVVSADRLTTTCTEQDFYTYTVFYEWDNMLIHTFRIYEKAYLPKNFVKAILELYKKKTTLKDVPGEEVNYMISKNMLNSAYGMAVTDIVRDEILYDNDEFSSTKPNLEAAIDKYNKSKKRFLFYPWGVWVTAYARANLFSGIAACGEDYVYSDTDSIKILNPEKHLDYINAYNEQIKQKLLKAAEHHHIDPAEFSPTNVKGKEKPIGVWDYEGMYDEFKTIGAKRYIVKKGGKYQLTVAGLNKVKAIKYIEQKYPDPMDGLCDSLVVPPEYSGRITVTYVDSPCSGVVEDYLGHLGEFSELSYIHMESAEYELTISNEYKAFLRWIKGVKEDNW